MANVDIIIRTINATPGVMGKVAADFNTLKKSVVDIVGKVGAFTGAFLAAKKAIEEVLGSTTKYAQEVDKLSRIMGATTEDASMMIQVAGDMGVAYETLTMAMKQAIARGYEPTMEGLEKLADEYVNIQDPIQRTRKLIQVFGTQAGPEMARLMAQGSEGIRELEEKAASLGLVLDRQATESALNYALAVDDLGDSFDAVKTSVGLEMIPAITALLSIMSEGIGTINKFGINMLSLTRTSMDLILGDVAEAANNANIVMGEGSNVLQDYSEKFSFVLDYSQKYMGYAEKELEIEKQLAEARAIGYSEWGRKITGLKDQLADAQAASSQMAALTVLDFYKIQAAADGSISQEEVDTYMAMAQAAGLINEDAATAASKMWALNHALESAPDDVRVKIIFDFVATGDIDAALTAAGLSGYGYTGTGGARRGRGQAEIPGRAGGGPVSSAITMVGEKGFELIVPRAGGFTVLSHEQSLALMAGGILPGRQMYEGGDYDAMRYLPSRTYLRRSLTSPTRNVRNPTRSARTTVTTGGLPMGDIGESVNVVAEAEAIAAEAATAMAGYTAEIASGQAAQTFATQQTAAATSAGNAAIVAEVRALRGDINDFREALSRELGAAVRLAI